MKYATNSEIEKVVTGFEDTSIARSDWKHSQHLVVALCYVERFGLESAIEKMRDGLFKLLTEGFKVDLTKEMPYHETLTIFWMRTVADFASKLNGISLHAKANSLIDTFDKDYPLKFYTRECLFSDDARARFVEPDLPPVANSDDIDRRAT